MTHIQIPLTKELSRLMYYTIREFYRPSIPADLLTELCQLHAVRWNALLSGKNPGALQKDLLLAVESYRLDASLVEQCDAEVIWTLTPEFAAYFACAPGDERVNLNMIRAMLGNLLLLTQRAQTGRQDQRARQNLAHAA